MPIKSSLPDIVFTDELDRKYPTVFAYGIAGAGKTYSLRSLKDRSPLVLATEDGNTKGMSTLGDLHIAGILLNDLEELQAVSATLSAKAKPGELYYRDQGPFHCLGVDSLSGIGTFLEDAARKLRGWDMIWDGAPRKDPRQAYPYIAEKGRQVIRKLMSLPVPLILLCRESLHTEGEGRDAKSYAVPELPGQRLPKELPGWPEATLRMRMLNNKRIFVTRNEGDVISRIRLKGGIKCPQYIQPNLDALLRLLEGDESALSELALNS